jgi:capsular exopolysaccharide synthesis family protein
MGKINIGVVDELGYASKEAFRTLRTNIGLYGHDIKAIAITSSTPKEGKTSVAFNLARSMASIGKKVIFIDADLRRSNFKKKYKVKEAVNGLSLYLSGHKQSEDIVCTTNIDNLDIVFSDAPCSDSTELLDSVNLKKLISSLKEEYDYIIIDTPALAGAIDGAIIARECDGIIVVIEENTISRKIARKVIEQLEATNCEILGVVINKAQMYQRYDNYTKYYSDTAI